MRKSIILAMIVVICISLVSYPWVNEKIYAAKMDKIENEYTIKVTWKERISYGDIVQRHYYLIYGELSDGTSCVLENSDSPLRNKYNGSDFYQRIDIGKVYTFFCTGERTPKYARYPNIIYIVDEKMDWD